MRKFLFALVLTISATSYAECMKGFGGDVVCGAGVCLKEFGGKVICSNIPGGSCMKEFGGSVVCE